MGYLSLLVGAAFWSTTAALVGKGDVGRLPAMGWNSWNEYGCNINESVFLTAASELVSLGLKDLGYVYVNIDDCWADKSKKRDNRNEIIPDARRFPNGISGLATQIHNRGLKLGIYSDAGKNSMSGLRQRMILRIYLLIFSRLGYLRGLSCLSRQRGDRCCYV
jgi:alpha-galactosidase